MRYLIRWFLDNPVTANLIALLIVGGGLIIFQNNIIVEYFPDVSSDIIQISTKMNGSTPAEVEQGVTEVIEEELRNVDGLDEISSSSTERGSTVIIEILPSFNINEVLTSIENSVNTLTNLPENAERPVVSLQSSSRAVGDLMIYGELSERELRQVATRVQNELQNEVGGGMKISEGGFREAQIVLEIDQEKLYAHNLTLEQVANAIRSQSLEISTGTIKTTKQELLVTSRNRLLSLEALENAVINQSANTTNNTSNPPLYLKDLLNHSRDGYADDSYALRFRQYPAVALNLSRIGNGNVLTIMKQTENYITQKAALWLPKAAYLQIVDDESKVVQSRIDLLLSNAIFGGVLVIVLLVTFLRPAIAFWVFAGMIIAICGGFIGLGAVGGTLNMMTIFAFIMVLGLVVDDATVIAENVFVYLKDLPPNASAHQQKKAILAGAYEVAVPVTFGMFTTVVAFISILFIEGFLGRIVGLMSMVVVPVLLFSFYESKFILPVHLLGIKFHHSPNSFGGKFLSYQEHFSDGLINMVNRFYRPLITAILEWRYLFIAVMVGILIIVFAIIPMGYLRFTFFPNIERDTIKINFNMKVGTPVSVTEKFVDDINLVISDIEKKIIENSSNNISPILSVVSTIGNSNGDSYRGNINIQFEVPEKRDANIGVTKTANQIRQKLTLPPQLADISFRSQTGLRGSTLGFNLTHHDRKTALEALLALEKFMQEVPYVFDITSDLSLLKEELVLKPKIGLENSGITFREIMQQIRDNYYGIEIDRFIRNGEDISIVLQLPQEKRSNLQSLYNLQVKNSKGLWLNLSDLVEFERQNAPITNSRNNYQAVVTIGSNFDKDNGNLQQAINAIENHIIELQQKFPGLGYQKGGETAEQAKTLSTLPIIGFSLLGILYLLIAIPTKSYVYPIIVMVTLPFALAGAVFGHWLMGVSLSMPGVLGMLAMLGVGVNSGIILVVFINNRIKEGDDLNKAIIESGVNRFRAIFLTSATTIVGLMPLVFEKSIQAQFLIPIAISMSFGIFFAALSTLFVVPVLYKIINDVKAIYRN